MSLSPVKGLEQETLPPMQVLVGFLWMELERALQQSKLNNSV